MGYDNTPSRDKTIFRVGIATIVVLAISLPLLRGYFFHVLVPIEAQRAAGAGRAQLDGYHADQARALGGIDSAIASLGQRGRNVSPAVAPRQSGRADVDAVEGWTLMKDEHGAEAARAAFERAEAIRLAQQQAAVVDGGVVDPTAVPAPAPAVVPNAPAPTPGTP